MSLSRRMSWGQGQGQGQSQDAATLPAAKWAVNDKAAPD
jgi:hypothetical protein